MGAAVVVASVVAAVGHRNLRRRVVRSGGQEVINEIISEVISEVSPGLEAGGVLDTVAGAGQPPRGRVQVPPADHAVPGQWVYR